MSLFCFCYSDFIKVLFGFSLKLRFSFKVYILQLTNVHSLSVAAYVVFCRCHCLILLQQVLGWMHWISCFSCCLLIRCVLVTTHDKMSTKLLFAWPFCLTRNILTFLWSISQGIAHAILHPSLLSTVPWQNCTCCTRK